MILFTLYLSLDDYLRHFSYHSTNLTAHWKLLALMRYIHLHFTCLLISVVVSGAAESGWASWWRQISWSVTFWHRPAALLPVQRQQWQQWWQWCWPIRAGRRCRLRPLLGARPADIVCGLFVWVWAERTCTRTAVSTWVPRQLCRPMAQGKVFRYFITWPFYRLH